MMGLGTAKYAKIADSLTFVPPSMLLHAFIDRLAYESSHRDFWECCQAVWIRSENLYTNRDILLGFMKSPRPGKEKWFMTKDECKQLNSLPDLVTVHRGCTVNKVNGLSWTLDYEKAKWFANRYNFASKQPPFDKDCCVVSGVIERDKILGLLNGRNETEVICDPKDVKKKKKEILPPKEEAKPKAKAKAAPKKKAKA